MADEDLLRVVVVAIKKHLHELVCRDKGFFHARERGVEVGFWKDERMVMLVRGKHIGSDVRRGGGVREMRGEFEVWKMLAEIFMVEGVLIVILHFLLHAQRYVFHRLKLTIGQMGRLWNECLLVWLLHVEGIRAAWVIYLFNL